MSPVPVSQRIGGRRQRVWSLIGGPTTMAGMTVECPAMGWVPGSAGPAVGADADGVHRAPVESTLRQPKDRAER